MTVMTAFVRASGVNGSVGEISRLVDRQSVQISSERYRAPTVQPGAEIRYDSGTRAIERLVPMSLQPISNQRLGALLLKTQLRMPVDVVPESAQLGKNSLDGVVKSLRHEVSNQDVSSRLGAGPRDLTVG